MEGVLLKIAVAFTCAALVVSLILALALTRARAERDELTAQLAQSVGATDRALAGMEDALGLGEEAVALCARVPSSGAQPNREQGENNP